MDNHIHALSLYFAWYNFVRGHESLKGATPEMASGLAPRALTMAQLAKMIDAQTAKPAVRGPYKKRRLEISN